MEWLDPLYVGESVKDKEAKIRWKINHNAGTVFIYLLTLPSNPQNLLDLVPARELLQKGYPKKDLKIIGIAGDYDEAVQMVCDIVDEVYTATHDVKISKYLKEVRGMRL